MSREAAMEGFERFLEATIAETREAFDVGRVLADHGLPAQLGHVVDRDSGVLERQVVTPELDRYRRSSRRQFEILTDLAVEGRDLECAKRDLLAVDGYLSAVDDSLDAEKRAAVAAASLQRLERMKTGIEPIVHHPADRFWVAATDVFSRERAHEFVHETVPFSGPLVRFPDRFVFSVTLDPEEVIGLPLPELSIDYTDEAIRAMQAGERAVIAMLEEEIQRSFEESE